MKDMVDLDAYGVGFDIPAKPEMDANDMQTPSLVLDLGALEGNIKKMAITPRRMACDTAPMARCTNPSTC